MNRNRNRYFRRPLMAFGLLLAGLVGLSGCFRHSGDLIERTEKRMDWVQEEVAEELEIKPHQETAYKALMDNYREMAIGWATRLKANKQELKTAFEAESPDLEVVRGLLKRYIREKPADAEIEALIDETVDFYATLDPEQQETIRKKLRRHSRWHH